MSGISAPRVKLLMVRASLGPTGKPSSASLIAGSNSLRPGQLAVFGMRQSKASAPRRECPPKARREWRRHGRGAGRSHPGTWSGVAEAGAISRPSKLVVLPVLAIVDQHEGAAADAGGFRLDQAQHHLGGDGGVHRAAAGAQHLQPRFRGMGIGGRDHVMLGDGFGHLGACRQRRQSGPRASSEAGIEE